MKRIEKFFTKIDNAVGERKLDLIFDGQDQEKQVKKTYQNLCPAYFKIGKCLQGESCNYAHNLTELERTYVPLGYLVLPRMGAFFREQNNQN